MFLPESSGPQAAQGAAAINSNTQPTQEDIALMQRVFAAAAASPTQTPDALWSYVLDWIQVNNLQIPIGQVFGYQRIATQVVATLSDVPKPVDGQIVLLKLGSSAPFDYLMMTYDSAQGAWASPTLTLPCNAFGQSAFGAGWITTGAYGPLSWRIADAAGVKPQFRVAGGIDISLATDTVECAPVAYAFNSGGAASSQIITSGEVTHTGDTNTTYLMGAWCETSLGVADVLLVGPAVGSVNGGGLASFRQGGVQVRWVSK